MDYDGFITAEDIARQFGKDNQKLDFRDLRTLIKNRDSKRKGKIDFKDFCKWMGGAIEPSETFYFRHDSLRNPGYEDNLMRQSKSNGEFKKMVSDKIMNSNLMKRILDKISTQWKTLKKAFSDLNQGKNGWISEVDLKKYLTNWGFNITDQQFQEFYEFLDYDKDGHITYEDFKKSVGSVISPVEFLYFRQDLPPQRRVVCKHSNCWEETKGLGKYCFLHKKIIKDKSLRLLSTIQKEINLDNWKSFIEKLKKSCQSSNTDQISIDKFFKILDQFNVKISQQEKDDLIECFHLKDEGNQNEINIKPIFEFNKIKAVNRVYKTIDLEQREDEEELSLIQQRLMPISEEDLLRILSKQPSTKDLWKQVRKCDIDNNGFLTLPELNTIFTQVYTDLEGKSLFKIFRPFTSIQNKTLVDYKKLREYLEERLSAYLIPKDIEDKIGGELSRNQNIRESQTFSKAQLTLSPRQVKSPSMRRMEQIKDEILKAAESSPLIQANKNLAQRHQAVKALPMDIPKKGTLEALISPRGSQNYLPKLENNDLNRNRTLGGTGKRVMSPDRASMGSKFSQYSTFSSPFFNKSTQAVKQKLEYEWKNVYRSLNTIDLNSSGFVTKKEFINCIQKHGVFLTRDEISKLLKKFSLNGDVNYVRISNELGLHKNSYDYMKSSQKYLKNATILKSIHQGVNDTKSQYSDFVKHAQTDRNHHRESTKGAIQFALENKKQAINTLLEGFDKSKTGKIEKDNFIKILKTLGIFLSPAMVDKFRDAGSEMVNYNSFMQAYS